MKKVLVIIGILFGLSAAPAQAVAVDYSKTICHHTPSNTVTLTFNTPQAYAGHLGTPHSQSTYDTDGACPSPTPTPSCTPTPTKAPTPTPTPSLTATPSATVTPTNTPFVQSYQGADTTVKCDPNVSPNYCNTKEPIVTITEAPKVLSDTVSLPNTNGFDLTPLLVLGFILAGIGLAVKIKNKI